MESITEKSMSSPQILVVDDNLSNILKYGDKAEMVIVQLRTEQGQIKISLSNGIRKDAREKESNRIGLRSVSRMMSLQGGELYTFEDTNRYTVQLAFSITHKCSVVSAR